SLLAGPLRPHPQVHGVVAVAPVQVEEGVGAVLDVAPDVDLDVVGTGAHVGGQGDLSGIQGAKVHVQVIGAAAAPDVDVELALEGRQLVNAAAEQEGGLVGAVAQVQVDLLR